MNITVINKSKESNIDVLRAIRSINRQVGEDFAAHWSKTGKMTLQHGGNVPGILNPKDLRGDAIIYLTSYDASVEALGYHDVTAAGIPYSVVYTDILPEAWTVTLSHEVLEMLIDPTVVQFVQGWHPTKKDRIVYYWYEVCDAVQTETYWIDGIEVSNFVTPLYFTEREEARQFTNFLGTQL